MPVTCRVWDLMMSFHHQMDLLKVFHVDYKGVINRSLKTSIALENWLYWLGFRPPVSLRPASLCRFHLLMNRNWGFSRHKRWQKWASVKIERVRFITVFVSSGSSDFCMWFSVPSRIVALMFYPFAWCFICNRNPCLRARFPFLSILNLLRANLHVFHMNLV